MYSWIEFFVCVCVCMCLCLISLSTLKSNTFTFVDWIFFSFCRMNAGSLSMAKAHVLATTVRLLYANSAMKIACFSTKFWWCECNTLMYVANFMYLCKRILTSAGLDLTILVRIRGGTKIFYKCFNKVCAFRLLPNFNRIFLRKLSTVII